MHDLARDLRTSLETDGLQGETSSEDLEGRLLHVEGRIGHSMTSLETKFFQRGAFDEDDPHDRIAQLHTIGEIETFQLSTVVSYLLQG